MFRISIRAKHEKPRIWLMRAILSEDNWKVRGRRSDEKNRISKALSEELPESSGDMANGMAGPQFSQPARPAASAFPLAGHYQAVFGQGVTGTIARLTASKIERYAQYADTT